MTKNEILQKYDEAISSFAAGLASGLLDADQEKEFKEQYELFKAGRDALRRTAEDDKAREEGRLVVLPFVAMVERSLQDGAMKPNADQRLNGRYAVVYSDKSKWNCPLIDICGTHYNPEQAEARKGELTRQAAEAALSERGDDGPHD